MAHRGLKLKVTDR